MRLLGVRDQATEPYEAVRRVVPIRGEKIGFLCAGHYCIETYESGEIFSVANLEK